MRLSKDKYQRIGDTVVFRYIDMKISLLNKGLVPCKLDRQFVEDTLQGIKWLEVEDITGKQFDKICVAVRSSYKYQMLLEK